MMNNVFMNRKVVGSIVGLLSAIGLAGAMLPVRSHLSIATAALILIIPVVLGVSVGGTAGGITSVVSGFLVYDFVFIPPYNTLSVNASADWITLVVYVVVMAVVARLVTHLHEAQAVAQSREENTRHLLDLSEILLAESPELEGVIVAAVQRAFDIEGVALVQTVDDVLEIVASAGVPFDPDELVRLRSSALGPVPLSLGNSDQSTQTLALATSGRPVGLLLLRNAPSTRAIRESLPIFANHLAMALERGQLRERVHHAELLEEIDGLRQSLIGAVSHDLRTPLATIKAASSTLVESNDALTAFDRKEMFTLIDRQTDRLTRLVNNLLDMTRIESGAFEVRPSPTSVRQLLEEAVATLLSALDERVIELTVSDDQMMVEADPLLITQVLVNLIDNANRHAPLGTPIVVEASKTATSEIRFSVTDEGSGVPMGERGSIFETFVRFDTGGRSGLGLAIAKAFIGAHGENIWVEDGPSGGARFVFTLHASNTLEDTEVL